MMTPADIQTWLKHWDDAKVVAVSEIRAFDQVHLARKYCVCMRTGIFADVTDLQIWRALEGMRSAKPMPVTPILNMQNIGNYYIRSS